jgi:hypothetical protein
MVLGVLLEVAMAAGLGDGGDDARALDALQPLQLLTQLFRPPGSQWDLAHGGDSSSKINVKVTVKTFIFRDVTHARMVIGGKHASGAFHPLGCDLPSPDSSGAAGSDRLAFSPARLDYSKS